MTAVEANELIAELESIDLQTEEGQNEFSTIIETRVIRGGVFKLTLNPQAGLFYIRARSLKSTEDVFETIDDHSYNKKFPEYIKRGRANFDKQPIFYAGRTRITALAEINIIENNGEEKEVAYGVSRWEVNKPLLVLAILNPDTVSEMKGGELDGFLDFVKTTYDEQKKNPDNEGVVIFYKYLSEKFTERIIQGEEYKYILTSTFANQIFKKLPDVAGILYQSVKWPETYNLAIKPQFIDEQFMIPSHFFKETFKRENVTELTEIKMEEAVSFNVDENIVKWE